MMDLPREGSRKRQVFERLKAEGLDAALALGMGELELKEGTVKSWASAWKRAGLTEGEQSPARIKARADKPDPLGRQQMECYGRPCIVIKFGSQQSEIKFVDDGHSRFVVNEWLQARKAPDSIKGRPWARRFKKGE